MIECTNWREGRMTELVLNSSILSNSLIDSFTPSNAEWTETHMESPSETIYFSSSSILLLSSYNDQIFHSLHNNLKIVIDVFQMSFFLIYQVGCGMNQWISNRKRLIIDTYLPLLFTRHNYKAIKIKSVNRRETNHLIDIRSRESIWDEHN